MSELEIAKHAYEDVKKAIYEINKTHKIKCALPEYIEVDGKIFFRSEIKN